MVTAYQPYHDQAIKTFFIFYFLFLFPAAQKIKKVYELPTTDFVGWSFYAGTLCVPVLAWIPYAILTTYGVSTTPLSHSVTFGNTFLRMFAAPLMSALLLVPSAWRYSPLLILLPEKVMEVP